MSTFFDSPGSGSGSGSNISSSSPAIGTANKYLNSSNKLSHQTPNTRSPAYLLQGLSMQTPITNTNINTNKSIHPTVNNNTNIIPIDSNSLRLLINNLLSQYQSQSAIFYADKLLTLTTSRSQREGLELYNNYELLSDIYLYSTILYNNNEYSHTVHILKSRILTPELNEYMINTIKSNTPTECSTILEIYLKSLYLASLALFKSNQNNGNNNSNSNNSNNTGSNNGNNSSNNNNNNSIEDALSLLLFNTNNDESNLLLLLSAYNTIYSNSNTAAVNNNNSELLLTSSICSYLGELYELLSNRLKSIEYYILALKYDYKNITAFNSLIEKQLLNQFESAELFNSIEFNPDMQYLKLIYQNKLLTVFNNNNTNTINTADNTSNNSIILSNFNELESRYELHNNLELVHSLILSLYNSESYLQCYNLTKKLISIDPYINSILIIFLCCLVELNLINELFYIAHQLIQNHSNKSLANFAIGNYYYLIGKYDIARRFYHKSTILEPFNLSAAIAFGHTLSIQDESDSALQAYRTCNRLFPGSIYPLLYCAIEYNRINNYLLAEQYLLLVLNKSSEESTALNELGVIKYKQSLYTESIEYFHRAINSSNNNNNNSNNNNVSMNNSSLLSTCYYNLGSSYRKLRQFTEALKYYNLSLKTSKHCGGNNSTNNNNNNNNNSSLLTSIGFVYHLLLNYNLSIEYYHRSLALQPRDSFTSEMLIRALNDAANNQEIE